jgi:hypothetical protein
MANKRNYVIALISAVLFITGYIICTLFFSKVPTFSYTADWTASHYFLFVWVAAILFAIFNFPYTSLTITVGCFIGIVLGDVIGQNIINNNWNEINKLTSNGITASIETLNRADYHKGVFIWLCTILISTVVGLVADILRKKRLKIASN